MSVQLVSKRQETARERTVMPCDFRASGLLSNESTRQLRSMHETFARTLSHSLDIFLGSPVEIKLNRVEQIGSREFAASVSAGSYLVPLSLRPTPERVIARFDNRLLFPLLDLLLGGPGDSDESSHELTEIDEELFRSITEMMGVQLERLWKLTNVSVAPQPSIKPALTGQMFGLEERIVVIHFELRLSKAVASFALATTIGFASALVRSGGSENARRDSTEGGGQRRLRDRLLLCDMPLSVDLPGISVSLGDILTLEPGKVVNLRTPVRSPILMQVSGFPIFEVSAVRCGEYKAAKLTSALESEA